MRWCIGLLAVAGCDLVFGLDLRPQPDAAIDDAIDAAVSCTAIEVRANAAHVCARRSDSTVSCWGNNTQNENGTSEGSVACNVAGRQVLCTPVPVSPPLPMADRLGLADQSSCAIVGEGVYCWGTNGTGEVGGPIGNIAAPKEIPERAGSVELSGGEHHICSRKANGDVLCAGQNTYGEVGTGTMSPVTVPAVVLQSAEAIGTGYQHSCGIVAGGVLCWGANADQQASGTAPGSPSVPGPAPVPTIVGATQIAGGSSHTCARIDNGTVRCWGSNAVGQLGDGTTSNTPPAMPTTSDIIDVASISAGVDHTCALRSDRTVACWGDTALGYSPTPTTIALPRPATMITSGSYHDCGVVDNGDVWCWGWGVYGQLGDGALTDAYRAPTRVRLCEP